MSTNTTEKKTHIPITKIKDVSTNNSGEIFISEKSSELLINSRDSRFLYHENVANGILLK